jgi:hypothetical protein
VLPWFENRQKELANRPLIREQAFCDALDPKKLERLGRYEVHLDRKLEHRRSVRCDLFRPSARLVWARRGGGAYWRRCWRHFIGAVVGAIIVLLVYGMVARRRRVV